MTVFDYWMQRIPDYYKYMYLDGFTPYEIITALRYKILKEHEERMDDPFFGLFGEEDDT